MAVVKRNKYVRAVGQSTKGTAKNNQRKEGGMGYKRRGAKSKG